MLKSTCLSKFIGTNSCVFSVDYKQNPMGERQEKENGKRPCEGAHHKSTGGVRCHSGVEQLRSYSPRHGNCHQRRPSKEPMEASMGEKIFSISLLGKGRIKQIVLSLKKEQSSCPSLPLLHTSLIQREEGGKEGEVSMKREGVIRLLSYRQVAL